MDAIVSVTREWAIGREGQLLVRNRADMRRFVQLTTGGTVLMGRKTYESFPKGPLKGRRNVILTRNTNYIPPNVPEELPPSTSIEVVHSLEEALCLTGVTRQGEDTHGATAPGRRSSNPNVLASSTSAAAESGITISDILVGTASEATPCNVTPVTPTADATHNQTTRAGHSSVWLIGGASLYHALLSFCKRCYVTKNVVDVPDADAFFPNLDNDPAWKVDSIDGKGVTAAGIAYEFVTYIRASA